MKTPFLPLRGRLLPARWRRAGGLGAVWRDALALLLAVRDPRTPLASRLIAGAALLYLVSPIDLIPDSLPVIGVGDDLLIVPALLALAARTLPVPVLSQARQRAGAVVRHRRWLVPAVVLAAVGLSLLLAYGVYRGLSAWGPSDWGLAAL